MKIAFNPSTVEALITPPNNKDITFDLRGHNIFARGVKFCGTDTNTWRDIKINNVSIGSNILDLRNGSNTTLTNTNGVVTINSTWRPVVDNLTSDSTTSSLSANQGRVLKSLIDGKSNSGHTHDDRYLKLTGGTMASNALITFADSGSQGTDKGPQGARGGLYWTGQSDYAKLYAEETTEDNLDLVIQFGDDNSNGLSIRNKANTQTSYISASGVITTGTFKGNLDWSYITNKPATATRWPSWAEVTGKPSSFTPSTHTHGLSNSVFFLNMPNISGNAKWKEVFGYPVNYNLLLSVRINSPAPEWCVGNYGSGILYGGSDTKGFMSSAYNEPLIMWAGGNGSSDDSVPKWYIGIKGIHKSIYNLATIASEANAAYNLRHSHSNKSVLDGITSGLVNNWNTAYTFVNTITGTDTDKVINKWDEIVNFLAGITEDNKLNTLLNSKLSVYELANNTNVGAIKNNGIYYSTSDASSGTLTNSPFNTGFALINMTSLDNGDDLRRSRLAFNAYGEVKISNDRGQANTAETWYNILTSNNSGISGSTIKLNGTSITVYSSSTADGRYVKKSGDTMSGVLTIDTTNFGALTIKRNDDANGASIQFRGKSSVYGYIGLNNSTKDKQFLRWNSDTSKTYIILDTSSTYVSSGKGVINGTTITQVDNATNSTNSTNARKLVNWYSSRPTSLNTQFGDGSLRIFYATSSTTEGKSPDDATVLHLAWDNNGGWDSQLAINSPSSRVYSRSQNGGTWQPWKTLAFTTDIPLSLKNPYSLTTFGVVYDGSAAKVVGPSNFISQVNEVTSTVTDGTMFITSWASDSGFADTNAVNVPYKRKAIHLWNYIKTKTDSLYTTKSHNHDDRYVRAFGTSNDNIDSDWGQSFKTFDPIPSGTPPEQNPNISLLSIGNNFNRRKQLAFIYNNDNIYYRRHVDNGFTNWRRLAFANEIPTSLKSPYALTISLNGTSQGPYDGSAAKNINITPSSIGAAVSNHSHDYLVVNTADDKSFNSAYHNFQVLYAAGGNGITGRPPGVEAFGLIKLRAAYGYSGQILLANGGSLYIRSSEDAKMTNTLAWKTILDSSNYSGILDSRYYTESEVNNLLSKKLNTSDFNWTNLSGKLVAGNEFNIVNAGFNEAMWFNYLPINDRSNPATINGYHFGNGNKGYTSIVASGFIKNGSSSSYVLLGDGGHKAISDFATASSLNNYVTLTTSQTISGVKTFSTQQKFTVGNGTAPFTVSSNTLVTNLNADLLDGVHLIKNGNGTGIKQVYYFNTRGDNTSYIKLGTLPTVSVTGLRTSKVMFTVKGGINFGGTNESVYEVAASTRGSIQVTSTLVRGNRELKFGYVSTSSNVEIWMAHDGVYRGVTEVEVSASINFTLAMTETTTKPSGFVEGSYRILASTEDNIASATKLATARKIWGQSFDGTADISGTLSGVAHIQFSADNTYNIGSNSAASKYIYTHWLGAKSGQKLELGANNSNFGQGLCIDTNLNVGIGTNAPAYKLHVAGDIYTTTGFKKNGSSDSYVLLGGGGHKLISDFATAAQGVGTIISISKSLTPTTSWTDTGIKTDSATFPGGKGSYIVQVSVPSSSGTDGWGDLYTGYFSLYTGTNSSTEDEILLHGASHALLKRIYLKTKATANTDGTMHFYIASEIAFSAARTIYFKFRKLI